MHRAGTRAVISDESDARELLDELRTGLDAADVALHGYALLTTGLWLVATPADARGLAAAMQSVGRRYVRAVNRRRGEAGGLFAGRYRAAALEPESASLSALAYVDLTPTSVGVAIPQDYAWSSARAHLGLASDAHLATLPSYWGLGNTPFERHAAYQRLLEAGVADSEAKRYQRALAGGWVIGSSAFVEQVRAQCGRRPVRSRAGRPRRAVDT